MRAIFALLMCLLASTAQAQDAEKLLADEQAAFRRAAGAAAQAVVQIETFGGLERVGREIISDGPTTGTIVHKDGWIISSMYSFRQQPSSILVALPDGSRAAARIVARDHSRELVLLKVEAKSELPTALPCPPKKSSLDNGSSGLDALSNAIRYRNLSASLARWIARMAKPYRPMPRYRRSITVDRSSICKAEPSVSWPYLAGCHSRRRLFTAL